MTPENHGNTNQETKMGHSQAKGRASTEQKQDKWKELRDVAIDAVYKGVLTGRIKTNLIHIIARRRGEIAHLLEDPNKQDFGKEREYMARTTIFQSNNQYSQYYPVISSYIDNENDKLVKLKCPIFICPITHDVCKSFNVCCDFYSSIKITHFVTVFKANLTPAHQQAYGNENFPDDEWLGYFILHRGEDEGFTNLFNLLNVLHNNMIKAQYKIVKQYWLACIAYFFWNAMPFNRGSASIGEMLIEVLCRIHKIDFPRNENQYLRDDITALISRDTFQFLQRSRPTFLKKFSKLMIVSKYIVTLIVCNLIFSGLKNKPGANKLRLQPAPC